LQRTYFLSLGQQLNTNLHSIAAMRFAQVLQEIGRLSASQWTGAGTMNPIEGKLRQLPGGSGLLYTIAPREEQLEISIVTKQHAGEFAEPAKFSHHNKAQHAERINAMKREHERGLKKIGQLILYKRHDLAGVLKTPYSVDTIVTDPEYRGMGLSKALYGVAMTILKATLVAGEAQTPGGRLNWVSLQRIPGVEIKGLIRVHNSVLDNAADALMKLGGQYVGHTRDDKNSYWAFNVVPGKNELTPAIRSKLSRIYDTWEDVTMYATFGD